MSAATAEKTEVQQQPQKRPARKATPKQVVEAFTGKSAPQEKSPLLAVAECVKVSLPKSGLTHKGQPVELTGRVAVEVKLPDGKLAWVRHLGRGGGAE